MHVVCTYMAFNQHIKLAGKQYVGIISYMVRLILVDALTY